MAIEGQESEDDQFVSVVLLIDVSGSMRKRDPELEGRRAAANLLIDRLLLGDQAAVVGYSRDVMVRRELTLIGKEEDREHLKRGLDGLEDDKESEHVAALRVAFEQLENDTSGRKKFVVFLTDGRFNAPTDSQSEKLRATVSDFRDKEWPIFPVAFGEKADREMLGRIAATTRATEPCDAEDQDQLLGCFQQIFNEFKEAHTEEIDPVCLVSGDTDEKRFYVPQFTRHVSIVLSRGELQTDPGQALGFSVRDPSGGLVDTLPRRNGFDVFPLTSEQLSQGWWTIGN